MKKAWMFVCVFLLFVSIFYLFSTQGFAKNYLAKTNLDRVEVDVKITASSPDWVQTIYICNISTHPIPLKDVELQFNYPITMPTSIWGQPWLAFQVNNQSGSKVSLVGGNPNINAYQPDPTCAHPITVQFNSKPSNAAPSNPFIFKVSGGQSKYTGHLTIALPAAPIANASIPTITLKGVNINLARVVAWGGKWDIDALTPGVYTITSTTITDGQQYFTATPTDVTIAAQDKKSVTLQYKSVPTSQIVVTLSDSATTTVTITLTGTHNTISKTVSNNATIVLPNDTYDVSTVTPGYGTVITPNPLIVAKSTTTNATILNLAYQKTEAPRLIGYFDSSKESSTTDDANQVNLSFIPSYMNVVNIAFLKPDAQYVKGSFNVSNTGLQFKYPSDTVLKFAISYLHRFNPQTKILASIGSPLYQNWEGFNPQAIADFVIDYGFDGVDVYFAPKTPGCQKDANGRTRCQIDTLLQTAVTNLRQLLPTPYWITITTTAVAVYGEDKWFNSKPITPATGMLLPFLRSVVAKDIDMVNGLAYDLAVTFNPYQALNAYANYYPGPISMGVSVPPETATTHIYDICGVINLAEKEKGLSVTHRTPPGMLLWNIQKKPTGSLSMMLPNAQMIATTLCTNLGLSHCEQPLIKPAK